MDNPWISYIDRTYQQIKKAILDKIINPVTGIPEMVDHSEGNDFVKMIGIWAGIAEMQGYYLDNRARETFITKLQLFESAVEIARQMDYRTRGAYPSQGYVRFTINSTHSSPISIPSGTVVKTDQELQFITTASMVIPAGSLSVLVPVKQMKKVVLPTFQSTGLPDQVTILEKKVVDDSTEVWSGGECYTLTESFAFAVGVATPSVGYFDIDNGTQNLPTDSITSITVNGVQLLSSPVAFTTSGEFTAGLVATAITNGVTVPDYVAITSGKRVLIFATTKGSGSNGLVLAVTATANISIVNKTNFRGGDDESAYRVYRPFVNKDQVMTIEFGNGVNGAIPSGDIDISYYLTEGVNGNMPAGTITKIVSTITLPQGKTISVTNPENTQGGIDQESLLSIQKNLPLFIRTRDKAVSEQDYIDIARLAPGVYNAKVYFVCGKTVGVYVLPYGGGLSNLEFRKRVWDYFENNRRMLTTKVDIKPVGEVLLNLSFDVYVKSGYNTTAVLQSVRDNLLNLLGWKNAVIKTRLFISDLYETVETTIGVKSSYLTALSIVPYAEYQLEGDKQLNWSRTLLDTGLTVTVFKISFFNTTQFTVHRNTVNVGTHSVGDLITYEQISFTVLSGSYSANDSWIFRTYPSTDVNAGKIELQEFSVITAYDANITLNLAQ